MTSIGFARPRLRRALGIATAAVLLSTAASASGGGAWAATMRQSDWKAQILQVPFPDKGCFTAKYPVLKWQTQACATPPQLPYAPPGGPMRGPAHGAPGPHIVGNGVDFSADVTGTMNAAEGSFPNVTGVTSETGQENGAGGQVPDTYSLQLNTKPFASPVCAGHPLCQGWQQFLYSSSYEVIFIQYWLLRYNDTCPGGWTSFSFPGDTDIYCYRNGPNATAVAKQPITNLANLTLQGTANAGGNDTVVMGTGSGTFSAANMGNILDLGSAWQGVEFIIVGDCCGSQANFNAGSTITVRTVVHNGTTNAPTCVMAGYTGETNNLTLVGTPAIAIGPSPRIESIQSNIPGTMASCAAADGTGDPHLRTFNGLFYDFQATGDFLLSEADEFIVHSRQISGAPTWPNTAVNQAVATLMGKTRVAVCGEPTRVVVDGKPIDIGEGEPLVLASGVTIVRYGNIYLITDSHGNTVRAVVHNGYIDVNVGLGRWPTDVRGLLANPRHDPHLLETRDGDILKVPVSFEDLYWRFGDSWRVDWSESLLSDCGEPREVGNPTEPFTSRDLDERLRAWAQAVCQEAGVKEGTLLEACILDVAVTGSKEAALVYVGAPEPVVTF